MANKSVRMQTLFTAIVVCGILTAALITVCTGNSANKDSTQKARKASTLQPKDKPVIIWFHNLAVKKPSTLEKAISNGIVSHALMLFLHPLDAPLDHRAMVKVRRAVGVCRKYKTEVIWARTLWPTYKVEGIKKSVFFDPNYYAQAIRQIKAEASLIGVQLTAIDTEPYGYFPFKYEFRKPWNVEDFNAVVRAVSQAIRKENRVDFVFPSAVSTKKRLYNALAELGKLKIAEHTYYDIPAIIKDKKIPYDIMGVYLNVTKHNDKHPTAPYFTPREILERQDLWAHKKGLFIYPDDENIEKVAEMLSKISDIQPRTINRSGR